MDLNKAKDRLKKASYVVVITGAGISAESGIPTFRGKDGLWKQYRAEELATPEAFARNPKLVWEWYCWRRDIISKTRYNPGHMAIAELEKRVTNFLLITQNVDGLHKIAGNKKLVEIHGNIWQTRCTRCNLLEEDTELDFRKIGACNKCGGQRRPNVVWFGESIPQESLNKALNAVQACDFMLVVGTSGIVQPTASFPFLAKQSQAFIVEVNVDLTPISSIADVFIKGKAGEILPQILD